MDYRIEEKRAFTVIGKSIEVSCVDGEQFRQIPKFWDECHANGTVAKLGSMGPDANVLGVILDMQPNHEAFTYMIASEGSPSAGAEGFSQRTIPAFTWAVFTSVGPMPGAIQSVIQRIYQEWFPATGYEHAGGPELEVYPPGNVTAADYTCEYWVPIVKK